MTRDCDRCGVPTRAGDAVAVWREYRVVGGRSGLRAWCDRTACRSCAGDEWAAHDQPVSVLSTEQGRLL